MAGTPQYSALLYPMSLVGLTTIASQSFVQYPLPKLSSPSYLTRSSKWYPSLFCRLLINQLQYTGSYLGIQVGNALQVEGYPIPLPITPLRRLKIGFLAGSLAGFLLTPLHQYYHRLLYPARPTAYLKGGIWHALYQGVKVGVFYLGVGEGTINPFYWSAIAMITSVISHPIHTYLWIYHHPTVSISTTPTSSLWYRLHDKHLDVYQQWKSRRMEGVSVRMIRNGVSVGIFVFLLTWQG